MDVRPSGLGRRGRFLPGQSRTFRNWKAREEAELPGTPAARLCRSAALERSEELLEQLAAAVKGGRSRPKGSLDRLAAELRGDVRRSSLYFRAVQLVCESIRPAGCSLVLDDRDLEAPRET